MSFVFQANYSLLHYNLCFYKAKFNDCSKQLYKVVICFRHEKIPLNLSETECSLRRENPFSFIILTFLSGGNFFTVSTSRCCFTSQCNNESTEENSGKTSRKGSSKKQQHKKAVCCRNKRKQNKEKC